MIKTHDQVVWASAWMFGRWGYPVATEVGLPKGRADLLVFGKAKLEPEFVVDVKTTTRGCNAIEQITGYADWFGASPVLLMTYSANKTIRKRAAASGVQIYDVDSDSLIASANADQAAGLEIEWLHLPWHYSVEQRNPFLPALDRLAA